MMLLTALRDPQTSPAVCYCGKCRQEVYSGEFRARWDGQWLCPDCFKTAVMTALEENPEQVAHELSLDVERYA